MIRWPPEQMYSGDILPINKPIVQTNMEYDYSAFFIMRIKEYLMTVPIKNKYLNIIKFIALIGCDKIFAWIANYIITYYSLKIKHKMPAIIDYKHTITFQYDFSYSVDKILIHIITHIFKATSKQLENIIIFNDEQIEKLNIDKYGIEFLYNNISYHISVNEKKYVIKCSSNILSANEILKQSYDLLEVEGKKPINKYIKTISTNGKSCYIRPIKKSLKNIYLQSDISKTIANFLNNYDNIRKKYNDMSMTYKTVFMVYGCPGTGKTSLAEAIASELGREIALVNLREITDINSLQDILKLHSGDVFVFEEIDWVIQEINKNYIRNEYSEVELSMIEKSSSSPFDKPIRNLYKSITISDLLETLDGLRSYSDSVFFLTTNHIDKLDSALKRHGRIDYLMEIKLCDINQFRKILNDILDKNFSEEEIIKFPEFKYSTSLIINTLIRNIVLIKNMDFVDILKLLESEYIKFQNILEKK